MLATLFHLGTGEVVEGRFEISGVSWKIISAHGTPLSRGTLAISDLSVRPPWPALLYDETGTIKRR